MLDVTEVAGTIEWVKAGNQKAAKATRIANLVQVLDSHRVWLFAQMNGYAELVKQLLHYPRVKHDDFADALARVAEVPSGWATETPAPQPNNWLRRFNQAHEVEDDGSLGLCTG